MERVSRFNFLKVSCLSFKMRFGQRPIFEAEPIGLWSNSGVWKTTEARVIGRSPETRRCVASAQCLLTGIFCIYHKKKGTAPDVSGAVLLLILDRKCISHYRHRSFLCSVVFLLAAINCVRANGSQCLFRTQSLRNKHVLIQYSPQFH